MMLPTSDLPAGVINLLSGSVEELFQHMAGHMEVHSISYVGNDSDKFHSIKELGVENMKRVIDGTSFDDNSLEAISSFVEFKTVWHPVGL